MTEPLTAERLAEEVANDQKLRNEKLNCNADLVNDLMTYSRNGALMQVFITCALDQVARQTLAAAEDGTLAEKLPGFIHPAAWADCARELLERMEAFYTRHDAKGGREGGER